MFYRIQQDPTKYSAFLEANEMKIVVNIRADHVWGEFVHSGLRLGNSLDSGPGFLTREPPIHHIYLKKILIYYINPVRRALK